VQTPNTEGKGDGEEDIDEEGYEDTVGGVVETSAFQVSAVHANSLVNCQDTAHENMSMV
jgi:hypothetical protein